MNKTDLRFWFGCGMMISMEFAILGSGSSANSCFFKGENGAFVIDCGFTLPQWEARMKCIGESPASVKYILITHHHADHVRGLERISAKYGIPSYVASDSPLKTLYERREFRPLREFDVDGVRFFPFPTFHDAAPSVGFFFLLDGVRFTIITDTGVLDERMFRAALKSDVLLLESNYCEELLESCCYPEFLKRRISSVYGHLSNRAAFDFLSRLREQPQCRLRQVYLCHLSEKSNTPERVEMLFSSLKDESFSITVCPKNQLIKGLCDDTIRKANSECFSCSNR